MKTIITAVILYLAAINICGFVIMGLDKSKARKGLWRIPEKTFFIVSLLGGSIGTLAGMYAFHHKTKHWYFVVFIPVIIAVQIIAALIILIV